VGTRDDVSFDAAARTLTDTDATGITKTNTWNDAADAQASSTDAAGVRSTTIYDVASHRPTDAYGPAPSACYTSGDVPVSSPSTTPGCMLAAVPHSSTEYDGGIGSLAATYYNTNAVYGTPVATDTGVGASDNSIGRSWGALMPEPTVTALKWGLELTGQVILPTSSGYTFSIYTQGAIGMYIDDKLQGLNWTSTYTGWTNGTSVITGAAGSVHRIRLDYVAQSGNAQMQLFWTPVGGSRVVVPGADIKPDYGLSTKTTDADGGTTQTLYQQTSASVGPSLGLATSTVVDPGVGHLNLTTTSTYDSTYFRLASHALPKGAGTSVTKTYYGSTTSAAPPADCGGGASVNQGGALMSSAAPTPASGHGATNAIVTQYVYDAAGRSIAQKQSGDAHWSCLFYDSRGRIDHTTDASSAQYTTTYAYHDSTDPGLTTVTYHDSSGASQTTTSRVDLLGRNLDYTDEWGMITRSAYNQSGRLTDTYRTLPGDAERHESSATYDDAGRALTSTEYLSNLSGATTSYRYDASGRELTATRPTSPNPLVDTTAYDGTGRISSLVHTVGSGTLWSENLGYTTGGTINHDQATNVTRDYTFDAAGRLVLTTEGGGAVRAYSLDADSNRCDLTVSTPTGCNGSTSGAMLYDNADRIQQSSLGSTYSYDANGNTVSSPLSGGGTLYIGYDAQNQSTTLNDGTSTTAEILSPAGRVLRHTVTRNSDGAVLEDLRYGYSSGDDNPNWIQPWSGGSVTSYLSDGTVLQTVPSSAGTVSYWVSNLHGDIVGTTNSSGTFVTGPVTDEFGVGATSPSRLNWLGSKERFTLQDAVIRMGQRLYDPSTGRFLESDPVEGGTPNPYVYVLDPVNQFDLSGRCDLFDVVCDANSAWDASTDFVKKVVKKVVDTGGRLVRATGHVLRQGYDAVGGWKGILSLGAVAVCAASTLGACGAALAGAFIARSIVTIHDHGWNSATARSIMLDGAVSYASFGLGGMITEYGDQYAFSRTYTNVVSSGLFGGGIGCALGCHFRQ
jgi:RHS repeat-associated protein